MWCCGSALENIAHIPSQGCPRQLQHEFILRQLRESGSLTQLQMNTLFRIQKQSVENHFGCIPKITERMLKMELTLSDVLTMADFVEKSAPIIIHFDFLQFINDFSKCKDQSIFKEKGVAMALGAVCEGRKKFEDNVFSNAYHSAQDEERPQLAQMRFLLQGVTGSFMVLDQSVRPRTTLIWNNKISTLSYPFEPLA
jgi:hypothetical protein